MTTFVLSLFLPQTVDFHEKGSSKPSSKPPSPPARPKLRFQDPPPGALSRNNSYYDDRTASLFAAPTPPKTPAAIDHQEFFSQMPSSPATHFPKPHDPRSLVRSDSYAPEFGSVPLFFNQPRSRAPPAPPDTILEYAKAQERAKAVSQGQRSSGRSRSSGSRTRDPRWASEWTIEPAVQGNGGLKNAVQAALDAGDFEDVLNVGLLGFPTDALDETRKTEIQDRLESEYNSLAVYVSDSDYEGHYSHYCKTILWPSFHYQIPDHPKSKAYQDHSWKFYENLNQGFADKVVQNYKRGDVIWIHDYHLLLVPQMIRKQLPDAQIGFFLHTAFPSSEVFRCLAAREKLLYGMLGANLVAFQTQEYAHHFLQTCSRILSVEATADGVQLDQRFVNVWSLPIGVDPLRFQEERKKEEVLSWIQVMQERYAGKHLIVARDKLDNIRGVRQKLLAFELFLNTYPEWKDKVVMIQVATSTNEDPELAATISDIVTRIDAIHSTLAHQPLIFLRQDIGFSQYLALLSVADVLMITSLREGLNLTCHEYVLCQDGKASKKKHGPIILSEFTGSAAVFEGCDLSVNPWDYKKCAEAIKTALEMEESEKQRRYLKMRNKVMNHTGASWMKGLSEHLAKVHDEHFRRDTMSIPRLSVSKLSKEYTNSSKRLFLVDYEGTLTSYGSVGNTVLPNPQRVVDALNELTMDERNVVYVMSGCMMHEIEHLFERVPRVGLIAENGCFIRDVNSADWVGFADLEKINRWKEAVKNILQYYIERVEGSWIEDKHCSLIFHYKPGTAEGEKEHSPNRQEKPEGKQDDSAGRQAGDCANHINDACENQRVKAVPTKDSVIIETMDWDKGTAAAHIMSSFGEEARPDFLMVAGNDRDDEAAFKWAKDLKDSEVVPNVITVSVGNRNTEAMSTLTNGTTGLVNALTKLAKLS